MIQRIQSVYLLLATLLGISLAFGTLATYVSPLNVTTTISADALIITGALCTIAIALSILFAFKNRKTQQLLCSIGTVLSLFVTLYLAFNNNKIIENNNITSFNVANFRLFTPLIIMLLFILAQRAIKKDDDLVKSADRLR